MLGQSICSLGGSESIPFCFHLAFNLFLFLSPLGMTPCVSAVLSPMFRMQSYFGLEVAQCGPNGECA